MVPWVASIDRFECISNYRTMSNSSAMAKWFNARSATERLEVQTPVGANQRSLRLVILAAACQVSGIKDSARARDNQPGGSII